MYLSTGRHHHNEARKQRSRYAVMTFLVVQLGVLELVWFLQREGVFEFDHLVSFFQYLLELL